MTKDIVGKAILDEDVGFKVAVVVEPVVGKLLRAEHKDRPVTQLVVFDDCKGRKSFAQADTVGKNAAAVSLQLIDDPGRSISLKIEQFLPDEALLISSAVIW